MLSLFLLLIISAFGKAAWAVKVPIYPDDLSCVAGRVKGEVGYEYDLKIRSTAKGLIYSSNPGGNNGYETAEINAGVARCEFCIETAKRQKTYLIVDTEVDFKWENPSRGKIWLRLGSGESCP